MTNLENIMVLVSVRKALNDLGFFHHLYLTSDTVVSASLREAIKKSCRLYDDIYSDLLKVTGIIPVDLKHLTTTFEDLSVLLDAGDDNKFLDKLTSIEDSFEKLYNIVIRSA